LELLVCQEVLVLLDSPGHRVNQVQLGQLVLPAPLEHLDQLERQVSPELQDSSDNRVRRVHLEPQGRLETLDRLDPRDLLGSLDLLVNKDSKVHKDQRVLKVILECLDQLELLVLRD
jgi:hypothetical protein